MSNGRYNSSLILKNASVRLKGCKLIDIKSNINLNGQEKLDCPTRKGNLANMSIKERFKMKNIIVLFCVFLSSYASAAYKDTHNVTVSQISAWGSSGNVLIQTNPKANIDGLNCGSDYWLKLNKSDEGYQTLISLLLATQMSGKKITVRAVDDSGTDYCRLERVITYQ